MAINFKVVTICVIGWGVVQGYNTEYESQNPSYSSFPLELPPLLSQLFNQIWMLPQPPTPPRPVQLPDWMNNGMFPTLPTLPVAPTPPQLPQWMTTGMFPSLPMAPIPPTPVQLPEWMTTGELPILPNQPDLTSESVLNTKSGEHLQYNGVAVRSSNDGVNSGTSMATNDNGRVKLAKGGSAPPDINKPLPSMDPNARFSSFSTSSFSTSNTVDGKTITVGGSDTKVNNDGKVDAKSVHVVQEDKVPQSGNNKKVIPLADDESDGEDLVLDKIVTVEDEESEQDSDSGDDEEPLPVAASATSFSSASSSTSSSSTSSSSKDGGKPEFISSSMSSFSSSSDVNGVKDKLSGSSVVVNNNGKVLEKKAVNREKYDVTKKGKKVPTKDNVEKH